MLNLSKYFILGTLVAVTGCVSPAADTTSQQQTPLALNAAQHRASQRGTTKLHIAPKPDSFTTISTAHQNLTSKSPAEPDIKIGKKLWVTSDRIKRRTCPSIKCGDVGQFYFRSIAIPLELKGDWARVTKYYTAMCSNGLSAFVETGDKNCEAENGIVDGKFAEWVNIKHLSSDRPADPAAGSTGNEALIAKSDDYRIHKRAFRKSLNELVSTGRCTKDDFRENGGWVKATGRNRDEPIYFIYCGGLTRANRLYLNAQTGKIFRL